MRYTLLHNLWERLMLSLPLVVMALLALGTYWLARNAPSGPEPASVRAPSQEPDYRMEDFAIKTFDAQGRVRAEVLGAQAKHYPDTRWIEINDIRIRAFDAQGRLTTIEAQRGLTNEDSSEIKLMGNAIVVREPARGERTPRLELRSEFLHAFLKTERVTTDQPVEIVRGHSRFTADRLDLDNAQHTIELRGRVRGKLARTP